MPVQRRTHAEIARKGIGITSDVSLTMAWLRITSPEDALKVKAMLAYAFPRGIDIDALPSVWEVPREIYKKWKVIRQIGS